MFPATCFLVFVVYKNITNRECFERKLGSWQIPIRFAVHAGHPSGRDFTWDRKFVPLRTGFALSLIRRDLLLLWVSVLRALQPYHKQTVQLVHFFGGGLHHENAHLAVHVHCRQSQRLWARLFHRHAVPDLGIQHDLLRARGSAHQSRFFVKVI